MSEEAERLRGTLATCRQGKKFSRYPASVKREVARYIRVRLDEGAGLTTVARELGLSYLTAEAWAKGGQKCAKLGPPVADAKKKSDLSLVPVVVRQPEVSGHAVSRLEVEFADGTRLQATGICPTDLVRAIEVLRRTA